jgi:four helix bundle protein
MARGSLTETQSHLEYGKRVGYIDSDNVNNLDKALNVLYNDINKVILAIRGTKK